MLSQHLVTENYVLGILFGGQLTSEGIRYGSMQCKNKNKLIIQKVVLVTIMGCEGSVCSCTSFTAFPLNTQNSALNLCIQRHFLSMQALFQEFSNEANIQVKISISEPNDAASVWKLYNYFCYGKSIFSLFYQCICFCFQITCNVSH